MSALPSLQMGSSTAMTKGKLFSPSQLRHEVIRANRECHRLCRADGLQSLCDLQKRVSDNGERIRRRHLGEALFLGI